MGSDKILVAICSVLDLYNCSRLVSGVQHPAILQEMVYILFIFSLLFTERFPHQQIRPKVTTLSQINRGTQTKCFCLCHSKRNIDTLREANLCSPVFCILPSGVVNNYLSLVFGQLHVHVTVTVPVETEAAQLDRLKHTS